MIIKTTLKVNEYNADLSPQLLLYKGDIVYIEFTLYNKILSSINGRNVEKFLPLSSLADVKLVLRTPDGTQMLESMEIIENKVKFRMDVSDTVGVYDFQIVCYDGDGCVFHLPPCTYTIADTID